MEVLLAFIFDYEPNGLLESKLVGLFDLLPKSWLASQPRVKEIGETYFVGPAALAAAFAWLEEMKWSREFILDRLFPDPPAFVRRDLDEARRATMTTLEAPPLPLVGRDGALKDLAALILPEGGAFRWRAVLGPGGVGKTRLAIEWLAQRQTEGWDIGIVDPDDREKIKDWTARKPTALVIDEASTRWGESLGQTLFRLSTAARPGKEVRVLVLDQIMPRLMCEVGAELDAVMGGQATPPLRLGGLDEAAVDIFRHAARYSGLDASKLYQETDGRPRAALILFHSSSATSYIQALSQWADQFLPMLADNGKPIEPNLIVPITLAALAGPVPTAIASGLCDETDAVVLARYFDRASPKQLRDTLPPLAPDDLAQEVLLRALVRLDERNRKALVAAAIAANPDAVQSRLESIWRERRDLEDTADGNEERLEALRATQEAFDEACPDRVLARRKMAAELADEIAQASISTDRLDEVLTQFDALVSSRPFDPTTRLIEATGSYNAITQHGAARRWEQLERWGDRLSALVRNSRFAGDLEIRLRKAQSAANAINSYGAAHRWHDLERWGDRLRMLQQDSRFGDSQVIALLEAWSAVNVIDHYGTEQRWDDLERWGDRLVFLAEDVSLADNREITLRVAQSAVTATSHYGAVQRWDDLERWGQRLAAIGQDARFTDNQDIRLLETQAIFNAITHYATARRQNDLERWEEHLVALTQDARFAGNQEIRLHEAMAAVNAIKYYGSAQRWDDLERWGDRLIAIGEDSRFAGNLKIKLCEVLCAAIASSCYGTEQRWDDLERWAGRLIELAQDSRFSNDQEIRLHEAMHAVNASNFYGAAQRWDDLERWGGHLIGLAQDPRFSDNQKIRLQEAMGAANAINHYGAAQRWNDLERWGGRLITLVQDSRFTDNQEIQLCEARGAGNALIFYGQVGKDGRSPREFWSKRLARAALRFPGNMEMQELASMFGMSYINQATSGFPYGLP